MQSRAPFNMPQLVPTDRVDDLQAMYRLTDRLYRARSLSDVYDAALDCIIDTMKCDRASILLFDDAGIMQFVAWRGLSDRYRQTLAGHSPWKSGSRTPEPIYVTNIEDTNEAEWIKTEIIREGVRGLGFIPLVAQDAVIGKFMTYHAQPHVFATHETELAVTIARQVGFSIERKQTEDALLAARALAEKQAAERTAILSQLAEGVIVTDATGQITFVNEAAERLHGVRRLDVAPDSYSETYNLFTEEGRPYPSNELPLARAVRGATVSEERWRIRRPDGSEVLAIGSARPVMTEDGRQSGAVLTLRDDTARMRAESLLREKEARLRALTDNLPSGMVYQMSTGLNGEERRFLYVSLSHETLTGVPADAVLLDSTLAYKMIAPWHRQLLADAEVAAIKNRQPLDVEVQFERADGKMRWCRIISAPRPQEDGTRIWDGMQIDITDQKLAEEHLKLLVNELNHRVKNTLATVQAIAAQTFGGGVSLEDARAKFTARLLALAKAHDVLTEANWAGAGVEKIVRQTLEPHDAQGRFRFQGPEVAMPSKGALALSMALHELCTNAVKFGALSVEGGEVEIVWSVSAQRENPRLQLRWTERGGPPVAPPSRKGFGSRLVEYALAAELDGDVRIEYRPGGVVCEIDAPLPALARG